mmetsp:Transcript_12230/g.37312  ORF Transcript_12230/g.37312 Transcript_12230/m.37312 type:complete len:354 (-) Transcript_12230:500-1561(-)|eukprot:CAMPEP_0198726804 /NCGR_PEP_ID=MMETSP1475-20131203/3739_1 /TAXON_ID= ORGANISM="Unidentified sp., Strain CCMP1999" /NCGR_SAMPLE_ID=MMETSP1475 /ASSEMBLY_ACC=CAM_ASM_001111 /LENGTH=353 /DNA_ID=CAMNT_0044488767 /DNA_START=241 /DNA_END=1302 /DNA_ORIENTATION=-
MTKGEAQDSSGISDVEDGGSSGDEALKHVVNIFTDAGWSDNVRWNVLRARLSASLEQDRESTAGEKEQLMMLHDISAAQQACREMKLIEAVSSVLRVKKVLDGGVQRDGSHRSIQALVRLHRATREKIVLFFMPAFSSDAAGFCARPSCSNRFMGSTRMPSRTSFGDLLNLEDREKVKTTVKAQIDEFVSRNNPLAVVVALHRKPGGMCRRGFAVPEELLEHLPSDYSCGNDGLCLWPALLVSPSSAADRVCSLWPSIVSFLSSLESLRTSSTAYKLRDDKAKLIYHALRLEPRHFLVVITLESQTKKDGEDQVSRFLRAVNSNIVATEDLKILLEPRSHRGWFNAMLHRALL